MTDKLSLVKAQPFRSDPSCETARCRGWVVDRERLFSITEGNNYLEKIIRPITDDLV